MSCSERNGAGSARVGNVDGRIRALCSIFSNVNPARYAYETRSVRLGGHATSIRLEAAFWQILEEIAAAQDVSVGRLLTQLHDEVLRFDGEVNNFASLLRCACLTYVGDVRDNVTLSQNLRDQARRDFTFVERPRPPRAA